MPGDGGCAFRSPPRGCIELSSPYPIAFIILKYKDIFSEKRCRGTKRSLPSGSCDDAPAENDRNALREQHYIFYIITEGEFHDTRLPASSPDSQRKPDET